MESWRDDIPEHVDGKGEPVQFNTANIARSPSPLIRTNGGGQADPRWGEPDRDWERRERWGRERPEDGEFRLFKRG
jgi:hypothetical protein